MQAPAAPSPARQRGLALAALGVVYGDIGTSPLYAMRECFHGPHGMPATPEHVLGIVSLIIWSLILVVTIKYVLVVLTLDNKGEGGILALMALVCPLQGEQSRTLWNRTGIAMGLFGAALIYGDGMITPAISVLSAMEGLEIATPALAAYVLPLTIAILIGLFLVQARGTGQVGKVFGPVILAWFISLLLLGVPQIFRHPGILAALSPHHALGFLLENGWHGLLVLGAVFLVVTGGEALYADMGHFGRIPIRMAWLGVVLPSLLLHYLGQGALMLADPAAAQQPFFMLVPSWALLPMVGLSAVATVIASQALISGAFSLTSQAIALGYLPRLPIRHTSAHEMGQIYIPHINWALLVCTIGLVLGFRTSSNLASAYGIAVTGTMGITTILAYQAMRQIWGWSVPLAGGLTALFLVMDMAFFGANVIKVLEGGWFPLLVGVGLYIVLSTWYDGRRLLAERMEEKTESLERFLQEKLPASLPRVPGTAVYMTRSRHGVPPPLVQNLRHNKVLHQQVLLFTAITEPVPKSGRVEFEERGLGMWRVRFYHGFMELPDVMGALRECQARGLPLDLQDTTFFVGVETLIVTERPGLAIWREHLFTLMSRNAARATSFFHLPPTQVVEIGVQIEL